MLRLSNHSANTFTFSSDLDSQKHMSRNGGNICILFRPIQPARSGLEPKTAAKRVNLGLSGYCTMKASSKTSLDMGC